MLLHPVLLDALIRGRQTDRWRDAERHRRLRTRPVRAGPGLRRRLGWMLVEVGLRLALGRATPGRRHTVADVTGSRDGQGRHTGTEGGGQCAGPAER